MLFFKLIIAAQMYRGKSWGLVWTKHTLLGSMGWSKSPKRWWVSRVVDYYVQLQFIIINIIFKYIPKENLSSLGGTQKSFSRVLSQSYGHHHARIEREPLRLLHLTAHTPPVWLSSVHPLTRAPLPSPFVSPLFIWI